MSRLPSYLLVNGVLLLVEERQIEPSCDTNVSIFFFFSSSFFSLLPSFFLTTIGARSLLLIPPNAGLDLFLNVSVERDQRKGPFSYLDSFLFFAESVLQ